MAKPSTLTRRMLAASRPLLLAWCLFCACAPTGAAAAAVAGATTPTGAGPGPNTPSEQGLWSQADAMVNRLREERRKLNLISGELERLRYMGEDFRDIQLYPTGLTRLGPEDDVKLDRLIEGLEKKLSATRKKVLDLEKPLDDAFFIAGEMLQESPNRDMIDILMKDNVERIGRLIGVQKELNRRWDDAFALLAEYRDRAGPARYGRDGGPIEEDFFKVLMANVGRASQRFYAEMNDYKDSLAARSGRQDWEKMAGLDLGRIKARLGTRNIDMVQEDLGRLSRRYQGRISIGVVNYYLGVSLMVDGKPLRAAEAFAQVTPESRMYGPSCLGVLQALFESRQDDSLVVRYRAYVEANALDGKLIAPARYLAVQSYYAQGVDSLLEREILASTVKDNYHFKSLFVYAKSLARQKKFKQARDMLVTLVSESQLERKLHNEAELALAHLNFEEGFFETGLKGYQNLLDQSGFQAEGLYGMVWCNIKLGDLDAAEFILKKLISQYPDNPSAMDGFMVLIRKLMLKARNEWAFRLQIDKEQDQLKEFTRKLQLRQDGKLLPEEQVKAIREKLAKAAAVLARQSPMSPDGVARLYQQALGLCDFVYERYKSGEFSEVSFNRERETVLEKLTDPGLKAAAADSAGADSTGIRKEIKRKLFECRSLALDIHVLHKTWLEELLKYSQKRLNQELSALKDGGDKPGKEAETDAARRRLQLADRSRRLADDISERLAGKSDEVLKRIRELAEDPNSAVIMDWLLFQKGYLNYGNEENNLKKRWATYQWLESHSGGGGLVGQAEPSIEPDSFEEPWMELIEKFPGSTYVPAALYYLGFTQTARGEFASGLGNFEELVRRFPQAFYSQQALIFIGEHYFNENNLEKAAEAYDKVLDFSDSKYFEQALYKLAWTRYRASSYKTAISSFTFILEESMRKPKAQNKSALTTEALQFAALSIAESDTSGDGGLNQSKAFADKLGDNRLGAKLLHRMATIYTQQGRLDRAKRALEALLNGYPDYDKHPEAMMELSRAYEKEQKYVKAAEVKEKVFRTYNRNTEWYKKVGSQESRVNADSVSEAAMDQVARHYLYEAKQVEKGSVGGKSKQENYYRKAISAYETFLQIYPENKNRAKYNYQEAEAYFAMEEYASAAKKYMQVSQMADAKLKKAAAYNAIVAAQELLKKAEDEKK